jgi:predicted ATPase/DNA-binding CsgD family transcriptional regulator
MPGELSADTPATPNNLPALRSPIVGRDRERAAARDMLLRGDVGLLTLTGPGGVGKTRLALQLAFDLLRYFPDGVYFVSLEPIADPALVVPTIAQTAGVKESGTRTLMESLKEDLRSKALLLVLDNFEQVLEAGPYLANLLAGCPDLKVLATSRAPLRLYEEHTLSVPPLDVPEPSRLLPAEQLAEYDAVRLFVQRARMVQPDFAVGGANASVLAELCRRLDGLPLAIELAAARVRLFPPEEMLARLEHHLPLLTGGPRDLPARQQTMRDTIAWSHRLLSESEKTLFRRLPVFAGGCTLEAAREVCDLGGADGLDVDENIASLVDKSLVRVEQHGHDARFAMLETIREYAAERLHEAGESELLAHRHAHYYLAFAARTSPDLQGREQATWMARFDADYDNIRAVLAWSLAEPAAGAEQDERLQVGGRLVKPLCWYWYMRSYLTEGLEWSERLLARSTRPDYARAMALFGVGATFMFLGKLSSARPPLEESLAILRQRGERLAVGPPLFLLGVAALGQGDDAVALAAMQESSVLLSEAGDMTMYPATRLHLGDLALRRHDYAAARSFYEQYMAIGRERSDNWVVAQALNNLGEVARCEGQYDEAAALYGESLDLFRKFEGSGDIARSLHNLGYVAHHQGDDSRAAGLFHESLERFQERGSKRGAAECLAGLAAVALGFAERQPPGGPARRAALKRSCVLLAAARAEFDAVGVAMWLADQMEYDRNLAALCATLDAESFERAWAEGQSMSLQEALAYALADRPPAAAPVAAAPYPNDLTQREAEVLRLVAAGLSNAEIAERLVLSVNTIESHLRSIYSKLGVSRRSAATRFALEHHLV